ncbi:protein NRT1/ PTR FAMILY 5.6-like [Aristolochia californica]|uniref:protein NRT1/ PTR FAMILY 5.6-like n=1 Tax=Aristolochia californica TaxID=171875 RepID=UPI0035E13F74
MDNALEIEETKGGVTKADGEKWVYDSSVDHKGRIPLRSSTGEWKASLFIIVMEFSERLSFFGIATNLIIYLTQVMDQDLGTAAKNVNYWTGVTTIMPLIGGFLADAYLGRFKAVVFSSIVYLMGLSLMTASRFAPSLKPCESMCDKSTNVHQVVFFMALYLVSVGTGGHKPSLQSFGADQFDENHPEERMKKMSFFNWWSFGVSGALLLGVTLIVYVEDFVSWGVAYIILTSSMAVCLVIFFLGMPFYRYQLPQGSPLAPLAQVMVAAIAKRNLPLPPSPALLYNETNSQQGNSRRLCHTSSLRFLDKAAIIEHPEDVESQATEKQNRPWRLATVTKVEETKLVLNMIPIWLVSLMFGINNAQGTTLFIKQGSIMNRKLTQSFTIPAASIYSITAVVMIIAVILYDKCVIPFFRRLKGNERGISILQRIGIGMGFSTLVMISAALVERKRLDSVADGSTMSVFWLAPQFALLGVADAFTLVGLQEYFYDQAPDSMRSLGIAFYLSVLGASSFLSSLLLTVVDAVTSTSGNGGWISRNLNVSRLDNFYWLLVVMSGVNLCLYVLVARRNSQTNVERRDENGD